jgi:hypothetical protein
VHAALIALLKGKTVKKINVLIMVLALLALAVGTAAAESYVEGYVGYTFFVTSPNPLELDINPYYRGPTKTVLEYPRTLGGALVYGAKLGTWFSKEGFPKIDYPDWTKYLGFYLDFNYHQFDSSDLKRDTLGTRRMYVTPSFYPHYQQFKFSVAGNASIATLAFMFSFRYGFLPTEKIPFGKLQPYVAVGPAIFITSLQPTYLIQPSSFEIFPILNRQPVHGSFKSVTTLGLEAELGLRNMITRFLSVDISVRYRLARPSLSYDLEIGGFTHQLRFAPQFNLFSVQTGIAYHF